MSASKFSDFLTAQKLDPRRILAASYKLERLGAEDRTIRLNKWRSRTAEDDKTPKETRKPKSGRPVTDRALAAALAGKGISGPVKTRLLKAVNHVLKQKKLDLVALRVLF